MVYSQYSSKSRECAQQQIHPVFLPHFRATGSASQPTRRRIRANFRNTADRTRLPAALSRTLRQQFGEIRLPHCAFRFLCFFCFYSALST
jgi:hypothetical protein